MIDETQLAYEYAKACTDAELASFLAKIDANAFVFLTPAYKVAALEVARRLDAATDTVAAMEADKARQAGRIARFEAFAKLFIDLDTDEDSDDYDRGQKYRVLRRACREAMAGRGA